MLPTSPSFQASYLCSVGQSPRIPSTVTQNKMPQNLLIENQLAQNQFTQNQFVQNQLLQNQLAQDYLTSNQCVDSNQLVYNDVAPNHLCQNPLGQNQLTQSYLTQIQLPKSHLPQLQLSQDQLTQSHLPQQQLSQNQLTQSHLPQPQRLQNQLTQSLLPQPQLSQNHLTQSHLPQPQLSQNQLTQSHLSQPQLSQNQLTQSHLPQPQLSQNHLTQSHLPQPQLSQNQLTQSHLSQPQLSQNQLSQSHLPQPQRLQNQLIQGLLPQPQLSQNQLTQSHLPQPQLSQNQLTQSHLSQPQLSQNQLTQSHLPQPQLPQNQLSQSHLPQLKLSQDHLTQSHLPQPKLSQNQFTQSHLPQPQRLQNQLASTVTSEQQIDNSTLQECLHPVSSFVPTTAVTSFPAAILQPVPVPPLIPLPQQEDESQQLQHHTLQPLFAQENVAGTVAPINCLAKRKATEPMNTVEHKKSQQQNDHLGTVAQISTRSVRPVASLSSPTTSYSTTGSLAESSLNIVQTLAIASIKEPSTQTEYTGIWKILKKEMAECLRKGMSKPLLQMIKHEAQILISDPGTSEQKAASRAKYKLIQKGDEVAYSCSYCGQIYLRKRMINKHWKEKHKEDISMTSQKGDRIKYVCLLCGHTYKSNNSLRDHWRFRHNEEVPNPQSVADVASNILNLISNSRKISYIEGRNKSHDAEIPGQNGTFIRPFASQSSTFTFDHPYDGQDGVLDLSKTSDPELKSQRNSVPDQEQPIDFSHRSPLVQACPHPVYTKLSKSGEVR